MDKDMDKNMENNSMDRVLKTEVGIDTGNVAGEIYGIFDHTRLDRIR